MKRFEHTIHESTGIHAGPAMQIARIARQFADTVITVTRGHKSVRADALLRLLTLGYVKNFRNSIV